MCNFYYLLLVKNFTIILNSIGKCHVWTNILKYKVMAVITGDGQPRDTMCQLQPSFVGIDLIKMIVVTKLEGRWRRRQSGREMDILIWVGGLWLLITGHCGQIVWAEATVRAPSVRAVVITGQGGWRGWSARHLALLALLALLAQDNPGNFTFCN